MNEDAVLWTSPAPLWGRFGTPGSPAAFRADDQARPAILRFASDDFMEQILATLAADPRQLGALIARPETWRSPTADGPDLVERVPLPRLARTLARMRKGAAAATKLEATTGEPVEKEKGGGSSLPLKLFHPAHQRHYLLAANLVCGRPGFPDRTVATGGREQIGFVLRRLLPPKSDSGSPRVEFAFVKDAAGTRWQEVEHLPAGDSAAVLEEGEELLPLFPLSFRDDAGHPRRLFGGLVPVGRREEYMSIAKRLVSEGTEGKIGGVAADPTPVSARKEQFKMEVAEPWKNLVRAAGVAAARIKDTQAGTPPTPNGRDLQSEAAQSANDQSQGQSWLILLDFADYLEQHVKPVWDRVVGDPNPGKLTIAGQEKLLDWLTSSATAPDTGWPISAGTRKFATSLAEALQKVRKTGVRESLEGATRSFPDQVNVDGVSVPAWPDFLYPLAGVSAAYFAKGIHESLGKFSDLVAPDEDQEAPAAVSAALAQVEEQAALLDKLVQLVIGAIDAKAPPTSAPPLPFALRLREALKSTAGDEGWFVMRCAYIRCDCGPLQPIVLSAPTQRFQLASFFDSDAPARPIRIALPLDTTVAGMRKHSRNTAFVISDVLCGQIQRAKGLGLGDLVRSVLPWPLHKDLDVGGMGPCESSPGASIGMICSLSIPIITICALILLMIIVSLLDFIFRWLPWFVICFPIPGLRAKK